MESNVLLILVVLLCLTVLAVIIAVLVLSRRKEQGGYDAAKIRASLTGSFEERLKSLIDQWKIVEAVKLVRETKNIGLKEAKDYINRFMRGEGSEGNTSSEEIMFESSENDELTREDLDGKVNELLMKKQKIHAIKLVKETLNIGLKEAKDYVEEIERKLNI